MLQELRIKNLALVRELYISFPERQDGLIVLTGETGAGKSMILQAIHLLTGGRGSTSWIRAGAEQAEVEAFFLLGKDQQETLEMLHEHGLASGNECLIRRVISRKSRSRIFINDRSVTARFAADLTENLINIASQHDHQKLLQSKNHLDFLDTYGELWPQRQEFTTLFRHWQQLSSRLRDLQEREQDKEQRRDFLAANRGLRVARPGFVLLARPNDGQGKRYGITVTKKIGNAVVRNRMKRRFRELLWAALPDAGLPDHDHILIGREGGIEREFAVLRDELAAALARAAAGKGDRPRCPRQRRSRRA
jgi:ribonuclease P protein component